ncbi:tryptophan-rich sensory protein [Glutamicibacter sp. NPDC087344]|uniref:tryptophan-rich sensory protein n=1 Tax=Glutamicibacter sp. NPDC087344 TaxID=3363994 RepID=UPI0037F775C8
MKQPPEHQSRTPLMAQLTTACAITLAIIGSAIGSGALGGTPIQDASDGYLSADATLLAPAGPAFAIWTLIYLGLAVFAIYQFIPAGAHSATLRTLRTPASASALLNALWIFTAQRGWLGLSVLVIFTLLASLIWLLMLLREHGSTTRTERWILWVTFGTYLGWVCVASVANTAAWISSLGVAEHTTMTATTAVILLIAAAGLGLALSIYSKGQLSPAAAISWGLAWIGISRLTGPNQSTLVGTWALITAGLLLAAALAVTVYHRKTRSTSWR